MKTLFLLLNFSFVLVSQLAVANGTTDLKPGKYAVCVDSFLRAYPNIEFIKEEASSLGAERFVSIKEDAESIYSQRLDAQMVQVEVDSTFFYVAADYLKLERCFEPHEHKMPSAEQIKKHQIDRARPHTKKMELKGLKGNLLAPVKRCRNCGHFKMRSKYFHPGEDLCTDKDGVDARAIYTGVVVEAVTHCTDNFYRGKTWKSKVCSNSRGFGNRLLIMHLTKGQVWYSSYNHLGDVNFKEGDVVLPGDILGTVGSTGRSFNFHLHFEIINGKNPEAYSHVRNDPRHYYPQSKICEELYYSREN